MCQTKWLLFDSTTLLICLIFIIHQMKFKCGYECTELTFSFRFLEPSLVLAHYTFASD